MEKFYIVGQVFGEAYEFCGLYKNKQDAINRCDTDDHFVALVREGEYVSNNTEQFEWYIYPTLENEK